ncbi:hypothetical protein J2809_004186 [Arthrobacter pascens]|nr:hypothetical protein [Arthrobacter pascens]
MGSGRSLGPIHLPRQEGNMTLQRISIRRSAIL